MPRPLFHTLRADPLFRIIADRLDSKAWGHTQGSDSHVFIDHPSRLKDLLALYILLFGNPPRHNVSMDSLSRLVHIIFIYPDFALSIQAVVSRASLATQPEIIISGSIAGSRTVVEYRYGREYLLAEATKGSSGIVLDIGSLTIELGLLDGGADDYGDDPKMLAALELAGTIIGDRLAGFDSGCP